MGESFFLFVLLDRMVATGAFGFPIFLPGLAFPSPPPEKERKTNMKEKKRIGHNERINLQAAIAVGP